MKKNFKKFQKKNLKQDLKPEKAEHGILRGSRVDDSSVAPDKRVSLAVSDAAIRDAILELREIRVHLPH